MSNEDSPITQHNDAIVTFADAETWARELFPMTASKLNELLISEEPALVGVSMNLATRMEQRAIKLGVPPDLAARLAEHVTRCGLITAELARRGYRKFINDTAIVGGEDQSSDEGDRHE